MEHEHDKQLDREAPWVEELQLLVVQALVTTSEGQRRWKRRGVARGRGEAVHFWGHESGDVRASDARGSSEETTTSGSCRPAPTACTTDDKIARAFALCSQGHGDLLVCDVGTSGIGVH